MLNGWNDNIYGTCASDKSGGSSIHSHVGNRASPAGHKLLIIAKIPVAIRIDVKNYKCES